MSRIIGVTVGTPTSPSRMEEAIKPIKTVNGIAPDANGNVNVEAGGNITTDTTFSIPGAAADAAAVGQVVTEVGAAFETFGAALNAHAEQIQANTEAVAKAKMPVVTEADNGSFLRVVDGAWAAVSVERAEEVGF